MPDLAKRINEREGRCEEKRRDALFLSVQVIKESINQGNDLLAAKSQVKHGDWESWVEGNVTAFGLRRTQQYMSIAIKAKSVSFLESDDPKDIRIAFICAGLLPEPEGTERDPNQITIPPHFAKLNGLTEWITKERETILTWEQQQRAELIDRVKPIVRLFNELGGTL